MQEKMTHSLFVIFYVLVKSMIFNSEMSCLNSEICEIQIKTGFGGFCCIFFFFSDGGFGCFQSLGMYI